MIGMRTAAGLSAPAACAAGLCDKRDTIAWRNPPVMRGIRCLPRIRNLQPSTPDSSLLQALLLSASWGGNMDPEIWAIDIFRRPAVVGRTISAPGKGRQPG